MNDKVVDAKKELIDSIVFSISKNGAFQRNRIYCKSLDDKDFLKFKNYLKSKLKNIIKEITNSKTYTDEDHYNTIIKFASDVSRDYKDCLSNKSFSIGTSQKLINLYWKSCWLLLENIPEPIHCPFDGIIIKRLGKEVRKVRWTSITTIEQYKELVISVKKIVGEYSIAEWELIQYNIDNKIVEVTT